MSSFSFPWAGDVAEFKVPLVVIFFQREDPSPLSSSFHSGEVSEVRPWMMGPSPALLGCGSPSFRPGLWRSRERTHSLSLVLMHPSNVCLRGPDASSGISLVTSVTCVFSLVNPSGKPEKHEHTEFTS